MITVIEDQSLLDIAIQYYGNVCAAFDLAVANKISITDVLVPGQQLIKIAEEFKNKDVLQYYSARAIIPATGLTLSQIDAMESLGIGFMVIGQNFIVE